jgi:hypothetical protein
VDGVDITTCGGIVGIIIAVRVCLAGLERILVPETRVRHFYP